MAPTDSREGARFAEEELLPLSALQHLVFCERQCGLIFVDQLWSDNPLTLEGSFLHDRTHDSGPRREVRGDLLICRGLPVRSLQLGVSGIADVVEFHRRSLPAGATREEPSLATAVPLPGLGGVWTPFPVEFKRGRPKPDHSDEVQLCAQGICLEEMLSVAVPAGALFYGATHRRHEVALTKALREETIRASQRLRELVASGVVPRVARQPKCRGCSLRELCRPDATAPRKSARRYLAAALHAVVQEEGSTP